MRNRNSGLRVFLVALVVIMGTMFTGFSSAFAATETWTPGFNANQHVQVDPRANAISPSRIAETERELIELGRKHHLQYYMVYTIHGDDQAPAGQDYARWKLNRIIADWQAQGLPLDDYVVVLVVRAKTNVNGYSVAATGGNRMQQWGFDGAWFVDVLQKGTKTYMPNDPAGLTVYVADTTNGAIDSYNFRHYQLPWIIAGGVVALLLLGWTIFWFTLRRKALGYVAEWNKYWTDSSTWYDELEGNSAGFIRSQTQYRAIFEGTTKVRFEALLANWGDLSVRKVAISDRFHEIEKLSKGAWWPLIGRYRAIIRKATTEPVLLSTSKLSAEDADMFKGVVAENSVAPNELLTTSQEQIRRVAAELKAIADAFKNTEQNGKDIARLLGEVDDMRPAMTERQLPFVPYQSRFDTLSTERDAVLAILGKNPLDAHADSERIERGAESLKSDIGRAIALKDGLVQTRAAIDAAKSKTASQRAQTVSFAYPFVDGEAKPEARTGNFLLTEKDGNPDTLAQSAERHYAAAQTAVTNGELDSAASEKQAAEKDAGAASTLVDTVIEAKKHVEQQVTKTRATFGSLKQETGPATTSLAALNAEFLATNFKNVAANVDTARGVDKRFETTLATAAVAYHNQQFVEARRIVDGLNHDVIFARAGLKSVNEKLAELQGLRTHAKQTAGRATTLSNALRTKLRENSFTTSRSTDSAFTNATPALTALNSAIAQEKPDWVAAAPESDKVLAAYERIDGLIDNERAAFELAQTRVQELEQALSGARSTVNHTDTRKTARGKFSAATTALTQARATLETAKSDWDAVVRSVSDKTNDVEEAVRLARADQQAAVEARAAIESAETRIGSVKRESYRTSKSIGGSSETFGQNTRADVSDAASLLAAAYTLLEAQSYTEARDKANAAKREADDADRAAAAVVAAAISVAVSNYEEEQRAEARRNAANDSSNNNNDSGPSLSNIGSVSSDDSDRTGSVQSNFD